MQAKTYSPTDLTRNKASIRIMEHQFLLFSLVLIDLLMVGLGFWLAYMIRFETNLSLFYQYETSAIDFYQRLVFFLIPAWMIVFRVFGLYDFKNLFRGTYEYTKIFGASTVGMMIIILSTFFDPTFIIARAWVVLSWILINVCVVAGRFVSRRVVQGIRTRGYLLTNVLVIGANTEGMAIARQLYTNRKTGINIVGFVDSDLEKGEEPLPGVPAVGSLSSITALVQRYDVEEIIVSSTALTREELLDIFQLFALNENVTVRLSSGLYEMLTTGVEVQEIGNVPLLSLNKVRLTGSDVVLKGMLDLFGSIAALIVFLPVMIVAGIIVRLDSPGPILYKRRVVGVGGKQFDALKFRTMYVDGNERLAKHPELVRELEENQKLKDDPRITRMGKFLRRTSLDEIPQLLNVLRGQMSMVGPRMITEPERALYGKWRTNLVTVKPGMTGLWQVSGRSDVSYEERVALDMHYIRNYSIWFDLYLLWQTIPAVLKQRGAY